MGSVYAKEVQFNHTPKESIYPTNAMCMVLDRQAKRSCQYCLVSCVSVFK